MAQNMLLGILTVMVSSIIISLAFYGKEAFSRSGMLSMLVWPGAFSAVGCFVFTAFTLLLYLFAKHLIYLQTITLLISTCCLAKALIDNNTLTLNIVLYSCLCFFPGLFVTCIFICFPYFPVKIALATLTFAIFLGNLYYANGKNWIEVFNLKNYRFLDDCCDEYFFPIPLFVFFVVSIL